jgi:two-component system, OmpR family, sensor histidine kinase TctE
VTTPQHAPAARSSLRRRLLLGILAPVLLLLVANSVGLYLQALRAADTAYDRTLLATAKSLGEQLEVARGADGQPQVKGTLVYSALEAFEADNRSRMFYRVGGFQGEMVSGFADLPPWRGPLPEQASHYAALVHFYDGRYQGVPVRMAVLLQPVAGVDGQGMATIQVAETLELRQALARQMLLDTLWRQALLIAIIAGVVVWVVQRATAPVRALSTGLGARAEDDLTPLPADTAPRELAPLVDAMNQVMARLAHLLAHQKRFVRDASHQLRTPLAVLKAQVQSAQRGDVDAATALAEIGHTVDSATRLANQMLALAKVEQLRQQGGATVVDWEPIVRDLALDLSPLMAEANLDFGIASAPAPILGHEWGLRELTRNLLHNAIKHSPPGGRLDVKLISDGRHAALVVEDQGPGLDPKVRERLFQPFAAGDAQKGSGLGLAICQEIARSLDGSVALDDRIAAGQVRGLTATVRLPLAPQGDNPAR